MTRRVIFTSAAQSDRRRITAWYRQPGSGEAARSRLAALEASIRNLAEFALVNRVATTSGARLLISQGHRVVYEIRAGAGDADEGHVFILRIYGPGQSGD